MAFKTALWVMALMFIATIYNVVGAYTAMGALNVQGKFQEIGLLDNSNKTHFIIPPRKPELPSNQLASL